LAQFFMAASSLCLQIERADQVRLLQEYSPASSMWLGRTGSGLVVEESAPGCFAESTREGIVILGILQHVAQNLDLRARQQRIAAKRKLRTG